jgi:hypothetical protein
VLSEGATDDTNDGVADEGDIVPDRRILHSPPIFFTTIPSSSPHPTSKSSTLMLFNIGCPNTPDEPSPKSFTVPFTVALYPDTGLDASPLQVLQVVCVVLLALLPAARPTSITTSDSSSRGPRQWREVFESFSPNTINPEL